MATQVSNPVFTSKPAVFGVWRKLVAQLTLYSKNTVPKTEK
jgi:hypothetical protein